MRHLIWAAALAALPALAGADPAEGLWRTEPGRGGAFGHVRIAPCGAALCGTLAAAFNADGSPRDSTALGRAVVWDMQPAGAGQYENGQIWDPQRDKTFRSKMRLRGEVMEVSGCVGPFCVAQSWQRLR
ncbi:DUF2147 domain-containing protein [Mangrovicoccus algicola]|uniref:DUF2147 domain-containing protein n=1 Tax=Mangrovicoccus algicola TaxID=2771008 RepID=A0A8J6Z5D6_9RHOB|nr:DUF2147 domain-containing protein [Mangrovicoccus algicola]MBE3636590.1 DUF2147 domain-containing protein [Mangrovicoccus algicola]